MRKIIIPIIALLMFSCDEEDQNQSTNSENAIEALTEYAIVNKIFQDTGNNSGDTVLSAESTTTNKNSGLKTEAEITIEPLDYATFPKTITINYGDGIVGQDGVTRKGVVTIVSTNWYRANGSEHTTTFNNFYHNEYLVEGTHFTKNLGENSDGNLQFEVTVTDGKITDTVGETINFTEDVLRTWIAGSTTPLNIWDDEYMLDGIQSGTSTKGVNYTLTIEESLHFTLLPRNIESGILNVALGSFTDIKINYETSTITILGVSYPFGD